MTDFQEILKTDSVVFLSEDSFPAQRRLDRTVSQMEDLIDMAGSGKSLPVTEICEDGECCAVVLEEIFDGETLVLTSAVSGPEEKDVFCELAAELFRIRPPAKIINLDAKDRLPEKAVISYFSSMVLDYFTQCSPFFQDYDSVYSESRIEKASQVIDRLRREGITFPDGSSVLEICCGNGMSTIGLRKAGIDPEISADINDDEISVGLHHGVLKKDSTLVLDASKLSHFFDKGRFDACIGFMIGTIHMYDKNMWLDILNEMILVTKPGGRLLLTIRTPEETAVVDDFMRSKGISGLVIDNRDDETEYDQWIWTGIVP
ncbi:class I SAM-dependent methyltransferase [Methanosarcinaceae archaeon]|nr:class I SAM-dependent methyltransferase [Methanosarcinaceae archaeon]